MISQAGIAMNRLIDMVIDAEGGDKYHENEGEGCGTKFGINGKANNLTNDQIKALTRQDAINIYHYKYADAAVWEALAEKRWVDAAMFFNMNVNLGFAGTEKVAGMSHRNGESLGVSLVRYYHGLKHADKYFYGWSVRVARNYEMAEALRHEFGGVPEALPSVRVSQ